MARNKHDAALKKEIEDSLKVSSYLDNVVDQATGGPQISEGMVPDFSDNPRTATGGMRQEASTSNESSLVPGVIMATDALFQATANAMDIHQAPMTETEMTKQASTTSSPPPPEHSISKKQWVAIQKYPALVETLGGPMGEQLVSEILVKVNTLMIKRLEKNAKAISKFAQVCVADKQNMKQYYAGENKEWVCQVIASGPFRGDEVLYFDKEKDKSMIIRPADQGYEKVNQGFNVVHEFAETRPEETTEMPGLEE